MQSWVWDLEISLPPEAWPWVLISALSLTAYYYGTLTALRTGNLSVYYPIIRSSPIVISLLNWGFFGAKYTGVHLAGMLVVVVASFGLQRQPGRWLPQPKALTFALLGMLASAVYSISDSQAMQVTEVPVFLFWTYPLVALFLLGMTGIQVHKTPELWQRWWCSLRDFWLRILMAGLISYGSYYLILIAFQQEADVALVATLRQASIPISVLLGTWYLREGPPLRRLGWALLLVAGLVLTLSG